MFTQISRIGKPLPANLALIKAIVLLDVHHLVGLEVPAGLKLLITDITAVEFVCGVHAFVGVEVADLGERFTTDPAAERPVILMDTLMQEQPRLLKMESFL